MSIEFNCRICNAMIRVPDKAAGGKGKCPKCGVRITVPRKSASKPVAKPSEPKEQEQFVIPGVTDETIAFEEPMLGSESDEEVVVLEPAAFHPEDMLAPPKEEFSLDRPMTSPPPRSSARRLKQRRPIVNPLMIVVAVALVILAGAAFFLYPILTTEHISGELTAGTAKTLDLPAVMINKAEIKMPADELDVLLRKLESSPIPLVSNSMQVELSGSAKGLQVTVSSTSQSQFYKVSFKGNERVQKYLDSHLQDFEDQRRRQVDQAANDFFLEYQNVIAKKSASDKIASFRDSLAIPALVRGFGYFLVAEHGRGLYRCVYEDPDGGLYFLLPTDVQSFRVVGRLGAGDRPLVPIDFLVKVEGDIVPPTSPSEKSSTKSKVTTKSKPVADEEEIGGEPMPGKK